MTVNQLHKLLGAAIENGHSRSRVCVDKSSFYSALEADGCCIIDVEKAEPTLVPLMDGDGGTAFNSRGQERLFRAFVLNGGHIEEGGQP